MEIIKAQVRDMRKELANAGTPKDTDEIRKSINMDGLRSVITLQPPNEVQNAHKHLLAKESIQLFEGAVEAYSERDGGRWVPLEKDTSVEFGLNEYHNLRTNSITTPIGYTDAAGKKVAAFHLAYRWVPPYIHLEKGEAEFLFQYDWFGEAQKDNPTDPKGSPLLRAERAVQKKFISILKNNQRKLEYDIEKVEYVAANKLLSL